MYLAATQLGLPIVDWIQEYDAFPLFGKIGGMPFPADDPARRAATIKKTIRMMREDGRSLMLFAEGILHRPPELMTFGKSLELVAGKVPGVAVVPVSIRYEMGLHERPECFLGFGAPVEPGDRLAYRTRLEVQRLLDEGAVWIRHDPGRYQVLAEGTKDVNERMDMRGLPGRKKR
jgi:1-acyl-sn-glycerol-3-phosphate acyltransferase